MTQVSPISLLQGTDGAGLYWDVATEGVTDVAGYSGAGAFVAKSAGGQWVPLTLTADGRLPIAAEPAGQMFSDVSQAAVNLPLSTDTTVASITGLAVSTGYKITAYDGTCFSDCLWKVVGVADANGTPVETVLGWFGTGSIQFTHASEKGCPAWTSGATGDQEIRLIANRAKGGTAVDAYGSVCAIEIL